MNDFFKDLILDKIIKASLSRLFLQFPFLGWGPIGIIISYFATKYAKLLYGEMKLIIDIQKIAIKNNKFRIKFDEESLKLKIFAENFGTESEEYQRVKNASQKALSNLIRFD